jgi:hypothetical protein
LAQRRFKTLGGTRVIVIATTARRTNGRNPKGAKAVKNDGIDIIASALTTLTCAFWRSWLPQGVEF